MSARIEFLEQIYQQLRNADLIRSKAEFSEQFLGRSPSYLTSMRARRRNISNKIIMDLDAALRAEIRARDKDRDAADRIAMRRDLVEIDNLLGDYPLIVLLDRARADSEAIRARIGISL